jgi:crossover junction endodeoxyribonuclease RuvC
MPVLRILGIDPGTLKVGYACVEVDLDPEPMRSSSSPLAMRASNVVHLRQDAGCVRVPEVGTLDLGGRSLALASRLHSLSEQVRALLSKFAPHEVALEEAFAGKSVQAALRVGESRGVILAESARAGLRVHQFSPARIKRCITGRGAADKRAVAVMVAHMVPRSVSSGLEPGDATDALAVALTRVEQRRSPLASLGEA